MAKTSGSVGKISEALGSGPIRKNESGLLQVPLSKIHPNPDQPRKNIDPKKLLELAKSIEELGIIQPITVRRDTTTNGDDQQYIIVAGERRFRASELLGKKKVPVIVIGGVRFDEKAIVENIQREDLKPIEEAEAYANLIKTHGFTQKEVADKMGKRASTISEILSLAKLPNEIKAELRTSEFPKSTLLQLAQIKNSDKQFAMWQEMRAGEWTVAEARQMKKKSKGTTKKKKVPAQIDKVFTSGHAFKKYIKALQDKKSEIDAEQKRQLKTLVDSIQGILREI